MKRIQLAISTAISLIGVAMLLRAAAMEEPSYTVDSAPTAYSMSHAIVQSKPGPAEEQPPTF